MEFYHCHYAFHKNMSLNDQSQHCELSALPFMHEHDWCDNKTNKTPNRDPKPLQKTLNYHLSIHPPTCQKNTHPQRKSMNNRPASEFHPYKD